MLPCTVVAQCLHLSKYFWLSSYKWGRIGKLCAHRRSVSISRRKSHVQREEARSRDPLRESKTAFRLKIA